MELSGTGRGNVFIVLNGKLVTRDHRLNNPSEYNVIQVSRPGSIVGCPALDYGNSENATVWTIVQSHVAHLVKMQAGDFK